jgi:predicted dehydrogenase
MELSLMSFSSNRKVNLGFVGCGAAFELLYQPCLQRLSRKGLIKIIGFVDSNAERATSASWLFPGSVSSTNIKDLYLDHNIDLTIIASPPPLHREHALHAFQSGSHVFCEKPLADSLQAAEDMVEAAQRHKRMLGVGLTRRYYPCLAEAHRWLMEKRLGRIQSYRYLEGAPYTWPVASAAPFKRETAGGGVLIDKGVHVLDTLIWLFGPASVVDSQDDSFAHGVESNCLLALDHDGTSGVVQLSWDQDLKNGFTITGEMGEMYVPVGPMHILFFREFGSAWSPIHVSQTWPVDLRPIPQQYASPKTYYECFDFQLLQFFRAMAFGENAIVPMTDVLHSIATIEACYQNARVLDQPWLPREEQDYAFTRHWHSP